MGVEYTPQAVEKLVNDLRSVRVQQPDGSWEPQAQLGRYVEPVQLQVVCFRLWSKIGDTAEITEKQIESLGDVDDALAGFYADQVDSVQKETKVPEKEIRTWFDNVLITLNGIRSQVMREKGNSGGLNNSAIEALERTHLIRGDTRRGVRWYELAHDRLIAPVRKNNLEWFEKNLSMLQRQAMLWEAQGRADHLLLRDQILTEAEKWTEGNSLSIVETEFLKTCQDLRNSQQAEAAKKGGRLATGHQPAPEKALSGHWNYSLCGDQFCGFILLVFHSSGQGGYSRQRGCHDGQCGLHSGQG